MFSRCQAVRAVMLIFVTGLLVSCGSEPPRVSEIQAQPSTTLLVDETASLTVEASGGDLKFEWTVARGGLSDPTQPSVIYTAPNTPGPDTVTVKVSSGGATTVQSVTFQVIAVAPTPTLTSTPADTPKPLDTPTPTPVPPPIDCNHLSITENVFPQLQDVAVQFPFYGPLDEPNFLCQGVYDIVHSEPLAVRIEYQSVGDNFGFWGIGTPNGYDATEFAEICFWAYTQTPNQTFGLHMKDTDQKEEGILINIAQAGQWTQFCTELSEISEKGVQLNRLENVNLGFNKDTKKATVWVDDFEFK